MSKTPHPFGRVFEPIRSFRHRLHYRVYETIYKPLLAVTRTRKRQRRALAAMMRGVHSLPLMRRAQKKQRAMYAKWVEAYDTLTDSDRGRIRTHIEGLKYKPLISVVVPVYNIPENWLRACLDSVMGQLYPHWELCIADDASHEPHCRRVLNDYMSMDKRVKVVFRNKNGHISQASNSALKLVSGEFMALLDHDDKLAEHALYMVALELNTHPDADILYSDEDKIDQNGFRFDPYFKSDWNPDLFYSQNMISHLGVYRTSLVREIGGFRDGYLGSQDYDLALRIVEKTRSKQIRHIPHVLYHWRAIKGSVAFDSDQKDYAHAAARRAIQDHLNRVGIKARVREAQNISFHRVEYDLPDDPPLVSILIPTHAGHVKHLSDCVKGLLLKTLYKKIEIILVANNPRSEKGRRYLEEINGQEKVRVVSYAGPFNFSKIVNFAVPQSKGEVVGLLNDDLKVISSDWLKEMVSHALRPEIGTVGAMLYYPNNTVQHAGVVLGLGGCAGHLHSRIPRGHPGYFGRAALIQNFSAVTAACLVMRREVFDQAGGFDENLAVAYNDVDFCLRVLQKGYRNLWTPYAQLYHVESLSRGDDQSLEQSDRFAAEKKYLESKWNSALTHDPYFNPNLSLLSSFCDPAFPPRVQKPWVSKIHGNGSA